MKRSFFTAFNWLVMLSIISISASALGQAADQDNIEIVAGQSTVVTLEYNVGKIATGNPEICNAVKTGDNEVLINAKTPGKTNVIIWGPDNRKKDLTVNVTSGTDANAYAYELKQMLNGIEGVKVKTVGRRVVVEGEVLTQSDFEKLNRVVSGMHDVVNLVELSPVMKKIVKEEITRAISKEGMHNVHVTTAKDKFILTGSVGNEDGASRAEKIALAYNPNIVNAIQIVKVAPKPLPVIKPVLIEMTMNVVEIDRDVLKDLGVAWNPDGSLAGTGQYTAQKGSTPQMGGGFFGTLSNLFPKMRKIQADGKGRSLMQQTLITNSGGTANFFAGTEIPIPIAQDGGTMSVEYKKVGVTLNFSPNLDEEDTVVSPVKIESSTVRGEGPMGAPIIGSTQLDTVVSVKSGSSIALAGLIGQREANLMSSTPPGGDYSLFQSNKGERRSAQTREVLIFVTPKILGGAQEAVKGIGGKVDESFKQQELENLSKPKK